MRLWKTQTIACHSSVSNTGVGLRLPAAFGLTRLIERSSTAWDQTISLRSCCGEEPNSCGLGARYAFVPFAIFCKLYWIQTDRSRIFTRDSRGNREPMLGSSLRFLRDLL